jgi:K+-sensing histidine kinase KdpD
VNGRRTWIAAVLLPVGAVAALIPLRDHVARTNLALALVIVVLAAAMLGGRAAGVLASLSSAIAFDFFLTPPFTSLRITSAADVETTAQLAIVGLIAGELVQRARRSGTEAAARSAELASVHRRAELAAAGEPVGRLINVTVRELTEMLDLKACRYVDGPLPQPLPELTHRSIRVSANSDARGMAALPVRAHGRTHGHLVLVFPDTGIGSALSADQRHAAVAIADQLGMAMLHPDG